MSQKAKHALILALIVVALGVVGHLDARDAQCSWNGCGEARYTQE